MLNIHIYQTNAVYLRFQKRIKYFVEAF